MRNKKLIPFETIEKAVAGEPEAIDAVLRHYAGRIKYLSTYHGHINDDIQDRLKAQLIKAILQFRFDRLQVAKPKTVVKDKLRASVLDDCFRLCGRATKRAQSNRPLALSIQYGMLRDRGHFSLDLGALQRR